MSKKTDARLTVLGVSLGNKIFDRSFLKSLQAFLEAQRTARLLVWLADSCEAVNYQVFRGRPPDEARESAKHRALELRVMFLRDLKSSSASIDIVLQSDLEDRLKSFHACKQILDVAYREVAEFRDDVDRQVRDNLRHREEEVGPEFIQEHRAQLAGYVLSELGVFYALAEQELYDEIYPGPELFVKRRLFEGAYPLSGLPMLNVVPTFTDISYIVAERPVREAA